MQSGSDRHASDEMLERYSMGRLDARKSQAFEEHLLICAGCQDNLALTDAYRKSMRSAALELRRQSSGQGAQVGARQAPRLFRGLFTLPKPVWIMAMAAMALLVTAVSRWPALNHSLSQATLQPALVLLQSNRGAESPLNSSMPSAKPFTLMLDLADLPPLPQYRLEIVDANGRAVFTSSAAPQNNKLHATIVKGLPRGTYYVRLYGQELLREYALQARD